MTDFAPTVLPVNWTEQRKSPPVLGEVRFSEESGGFIKRAQIAIWETEQRAKDQTAKERADASDGVGVIINNGFIRCGPVVFEVDAIIGKEAPENERAEALKYVVDSMAAAAPGMAALGACETLPAE